MEYKGPLLEIKKEEDELEILRQKEYDLKKLFDLFSRHQQEINFRDKSFKERYLSEQEDEIMNSIKLYNSLNQEITIYISNLRKDIKKKKSINKEEYTREINMAESIISKFCPKIDEIIKEISNQIDSTLYKFVEEEDYKGKKRKSSGLKKIMKPRIHLIKLEIKVEKLLPQKIDRLKHYESKFFGSISIYRKQDFFYDKPDIMKVIKDSEHLINQIKFHVAKLYLLYDKDNNYEKFFDVYNKVSPFHDKFLEIKKIIEKKIENILNFIKNNFEILKDELKEEKKQVEQVYQKALDNANKMNTIFVQRNSGRDTFPGRNIYDEDIRFSDIERFEQKKEEDEEKEKVDIGESGGLEDENSNQDGNEKEEEGEGEENNKNNEGDKKNKKENKKKKTWIIFPVIAIVILLAVTGGFLYLKYFS